MRYRGRHELNQGREERVISRKKKTGRAPLNYSQVAQHHNTQYLTISHHRILYRTIEYYIALQNTVAHQNTISHYRILYRTIEYYISLQNTISHYRILYHTIEYYIALQNTISHYRILYHIIEYYIALQNTISHYRILYRTIEYYITLQNTISLRHLAEQQESREAVQATIVTTKAASCSTFSHMDRVISSIFWREAAWLGMFWCRRTISLLSCCSAR